jgi:hypothetical protein
VITTVLPVIAVIGATLPAIVDGMRFSFVIAIAACSSSDTPGTTPKAPNDELIVGEFERRAPATTAYRFKRDGSLVVAESRAKLDDDPPLATGSWKLDENTLSLDYRSGDCADAGTGRYTVVISKIGIRFTKLDDKCESRAKLDGQTVWRAERE